MLEVSQEDLLSSLRRVGVSPGDALLVHSALQYLGKPKGGPELYLSTLMEALGIDGATDGSGTLAVPAFNFGFARGQAYDPQNTPSQGMGVLSELVRMHPLAKRTSHPMQSLAVIGRHADDLASRDTPSAFDPGSAFERMLELDFSILLLGADIQAISVLHLVEQRLGVPYRYWKEFNGEVRMPQGWERKTYRMFVRDLDLDPHIDLHPVQRRLEERRQWLSTPLNYGQVARCRMADFVAAVSEFLEKDPWSLVTNPPQGESTWEGGRLAKQPCEPIRQKPQSVTSDSQNEVASS
jgi:aminoglycoside 3-N-acetyltransferase